MKDLIPVVTSNINNSEVNSVSARELYLGLGLASDQWSRWSNKNVLKNKYFTQGIDFIELDIKSSSPNPPKDYAVTIEFAKHLAMKADTENAHDYRNYFIECEKQVLSKAIERIVTPKEAVGYLEGYLEASKLLQIPVHLAQIESAKLTLKDTNIDFSPLLKLTSVQDDITKSDLMLEPTELGRRLGYSGAEMNRVLERLGLQTRLNGKDWIPTEQGELISFYHSWTKFGKSGYNYKWNISEVEKLIPKSL